MKKGGQGHTDGGNTMGQLSSHGWEQHLERGTQATTSSRLSRLSVRRGRRDEDGSWSPRALPAERATTNVAIEKRSRTDKTKRRMSDIQGRRCSKDTTKVRAAAPEIYDLWWVEPTKTDLRNRRWGQNGQGRNRVTRTMKKSTNQIMKETESEC